MNTLETVAVKSARTDVALGTPRPSGGGSGLSRQEESCLIGQAQAGNHAALERLVEANIRLVYSVARRVARGYRCRTYSLEDLVQEGIVGLIVAVNRFDETRGCRLSTYAVHWIRQAIARAVEQNDRLIHVPAQVTAELRRVHQLREERQRDLCRSVSEAELAEVSGIAEERMCQLMVASQDAISLEALIGAEQDSPLLELAEDPTCVNPEQGALVGAYKHQLRLLVQELRPREREIVEERFGLNGRSPRTLESISQQMRISRERVRQIEARAIRKLRLALRDTQWE